MVGGLTELADFPLVGPLLASPEANYFISYGGMLFDLLIGFALLWKRTRLLACVLVIGFHLTNGLVLYGDIGVFPYLGMASTILFFEPDAPRRFLRRLRRAFASGHRSETVATDSAAASPKPPYAHQTAVCTFVVAYLTIQALVPFRHWLYPGHVNWTEGGSRFAWRMKIRAKAGEVTFRVVDRATGQTRIIGFDALRQDIVGWQAVVMARHPDMILQYAHHLKRKHEDEGMQSTSVYADSWAGLNTRPWSRLIHPTVDLTTVSWNPFAHERWITPMPARLDSGDEIGRERGTSAP